MSFFNELKRRNVVRVGIAYVIVAWLVAQVAELAADSFGAPDWVMKMAITALALGLPIAIFFAWAFELTPDGLKKEKDVDRSQSIVSQTGRKLDRAIIGVLVIALGYFVADKFWLTPASQNEVTTQVAETSAAAEKSPESIAVLPFVDMSPDGDNEYFSDGLSEEMLNILAKIKNLQVAGRTSSFAFKGRNEDLREIGQKLGVKTILEGSVRKDESGTRVRITAQLVNVENGFHLWSETYDRELKDIFAIQDEIAHEVAAALRITLLGEEEQKITARAVTDLNAYDLYLQGLKNFNDRSYGSMTQARIDFERAMALDPDYLPAQLGLLKVMHELMFTGAITRQENVETSLPLVTKILEAHPENAEAHILMSHMHMVRNEPTGRRKELNLALDAEPRNAEALNEMGRFIFDMGDTRTGTEYLLEAERIDPYSVTLLWDLCITNAFMLKPDEASGYCERIGEIQPDNPMRHYGKAMAHSFNGNLVQSLYFNQKSIELDPNDYELPAQMAMEWISLGDTEQAEIWLQKAEEIGAGQPVPLMARLMMHQYREQYGMAANVARRALEKELDNRQGSDRIFQYVYADFMVEKDNINEAIEYFRNEHPGAFEIPPVFDFSVPNGANDLFIIGKLMLLQDPKSEQAEEILNAAEAKWKVRDEAWFPWAHELNRASLAIVRGNRNKAIEHLFKAYEKNHRLNWRTTLAAFGYRELRGEPEFKRLVAMYEADMDRQREEAYELLGIER